MNTYEARIYVGLREGYTENLLGIEELEAECERFVDDKGVCVTVTGTTFIYPGGEEPGAIVGFIDYPRFPLGPKVIKERALELGGILRQKLGQWSVSVVCTDETIILGN